MHVKNILLLCTVFTFVSCGGGSSTYTISGKVEGLHNGTLTLQNNGADDLVIEKDGSFTFKTKVSDKEKFDVQTFREPCEQSCSIKNGLGTIERKNIDNVEINCLAKTWTETKEFFQGTAFEGLQINVSGNGVAINKTGDIIALWRLNGHVFKSEYRNKKWAHPQDKNDYIHFGNIEPVGASVRLNDSGDAILLSETSKDGLGDIFVSTYHAGVWQDPKSFSDRLNPASARSSIIVDIKFNNKGNAIVVWTQQNINYKFGLYKAEYRSGAWIPPQLLSDSLSESGINISFDVEMNNRDEIVILWKKYFGEGPHQNGLFKTEYRDGNWSSIAQTNEQINPINGDIEIYSLALNDNGDIVIVWVQDNESDYMLRIYKSEYISGKWILPKSVDDALNSSTLYFSNYPHLKMDSSGYVIITWGQDGDISIAERINGEWIISNKSKIFNSSEWPYFLDLQLSDMGDAIVTWETRHTDDEHDYSNFERKTYKLERRNHSWNGPIVEADYIDRNWNMSNVVSKIDEIGNSILLWAIDDGNENADFPNKITKKMEYRLGHWSADETIDSVIFYHFHSYDDPAAPTIGMKECREIVFWQTRKLDYSIPTYFKHYR